MSAQEFAKQYLQDWKPSIKDTELHELAKEYVRRTEEYDRSVCSGPVIDGLIYPNNPREQRLIVSNAQLVFKEICQRASAHGITIEELKTVIARYA